MGQVKRQRRVYDPTSEPMQATIGGVQTVVDIIDKSEGGACFLLPGNSMVVEGDWIFIQSSWGVVKWVKRQLSTISIGVQFL